MVRGRYEVKTDMSYLLEGLRQSLTLFVLGPMNSEEVRMKASGHIFFTLLTQFVQGSQQIPGLLSRAKLPAPGQSNDDDG